MHDGANKDGVSRREFLLAVGAATPTIKLLGAESAGTANANPPGPATGSDGKFTTMDLSAYFNSSAQEFGTRERAAMIGGESANDSLIRVLGGNRNVQGIPFILGSEDLSSKSWIVLTTEPGTASATQVEIPVGRTAHFVCVTSFCDFDPNETPAPDQDLFEQVGQLLANLTLIYDDGGTQVFPIRRRYETNSVTEAWGHMCLLAMEPGKNHAVKLTDPLPVGTAWGNLQTVVEVSLAGAPHRGSLWVCALENPQPDKTVRTVRLEAAGKDKLVVCGMTLYHRADYPLRNEPRAVYRITLPEADNDISRWRFSLDLGTVGHTYTLPHFDPQSWLAAPAPGLGERAAGDSESRNLYAEIIANTQATLSLNDGKTGKHYTFELAQIVPGQELPATEGNGSIEIVEHGRRWVHFQVLDSETRRPAPVRLAFRSKEGRYIPPYGHRADINDAWFQDYGADVKLMDTSFAYVDGTFQVELPPGEVYVEMTKGFEHQAVRQKLVIQPGQRDVTLEIPRFTNLRAKGWVTADTHTHFLSPTTAVLEAQAEGLNLINLLAAQWGDLFTNVGDLSQGPLFSADRESMVWVGSENRQHILGHIGLEGVQGKPVFPMSADGPSEAYLGDPVWTSMAEWADVCRKRHGLSVAVHFPYPTGEIAADIVLGKIDAVEIWPRDEMQVHPTAMIQFDSLRYRDWYHYLNCGYRLPAVAGTDKMGAYMPAGTNRVYAYLGQQEFNYPNFAQAVRAGNTFATSGPLLMFKADGHVPGGEITLGTGGGTIEVLADAQCFVPIHRVEVIFNGKVVARHDEPAGARTLHVSEKVHVEGPGWLAARCSSHSGPTTNWNFKIAAHTSAVYVNVPGRELFSPEAAAYFLKLIDGVQMYVETLGTRPDPETFARVRKVYTDARAELHRRMHQHGIPH